MTYSAEIISVGTELLLGNTANTDARDLSQMLSELGIDVFYHTVVGDNDERLKKIVNIARARSNIIITTGGLGPTYDDMTKQTLAECFGKRLVFDESEAEIIRSYFSERLHSTKMTDNNLRQALLPEGCTVFHNSCGTAPGCAFESDGVHVLMLPGPPRECASMFKNCAAPYLRKLSDSIIVSHKINIFGKGESLVEDMLSTIMPKLSNPTLAPYAKEGEVMLRLTAKAATENEAGSLMQPVLTNVLGILGDFVYGVDTDSFESAVLKLLSDKKKTVVTAESCTGGMISKRLTDVPGASASFLGGIVTYSNSSKTELLGVPEDVLSIHGAVSKECAEKMALGVRARLAADIGISVTGIAGPSNDSMYKDIGLVYVALAAKDGLYCRQLHLGSDRYRVRTVASNHAFDMIRRYLSGLPVEADWAEEK